MVSTSVQATDLHQMLQHVKSHADAATTIEATLKENGEWTPEMSMAFQGTMMSTDGLEKYKVSKNYPRECARIEEIWWRQNMPAFWDRVVSSFPLSNRFIRPLQRRELVKVALLIMTVFAIFRMLM